MHGVRIDPERREIRWLRRFVPLAGTRVLEIGSGNGRLTQRLANGLDQLVSVDTDKSAISQARRIAGRLPCPVHIGLASAVDLPFSDAAFDIVVLSWAL